MTFLFDIGRVLLDFDFESSLARLLPPGTTDGRERMEQLLDRKDEFEAGRIPADEYIPWALDVMGSSATHDEFRYWWQRIFTPNLPMWETVRRLSADGHRLILFSNTNAIHCPWVFDEFPEFELFHEAVLSYETGSIKPHPEIYQYAIDAHGLDPTTTLYIDDLPQNISTGREFGFQCFLYDLNHHSAFEVWLTDVLNYQSSNSKA